MDKSSLHSGKWNKTYRRISYKWYMAFYNNVRWGWLNDINKKILEYKNYMSTKPNDTIYSRWGMYTQDNRYKDYTASIVKMIMDDMDINEDQAYYMLYYIISNDIDDYERAKRDMKVDVNFEMYRIKWEGELWN